MDEEALVEVEKKITLSPLYKCTKRTALGSNNTETAKPNLANPRLGAARECDPLGEDCSRSHDSSACSGHSAIQRRRLRRVSICAANGLPYAQQTVGAVDLIANFVVSVSEVPLSENTSLNFHQLAIIISFSTGSAAIALSFFLIWMHALHYTKPIEQRKCV